MLGKHDAVANIAVRDLEASATFYEQTLGLKRVHDVVVKEDRPEIRGMVKTVTHLVTVEEVE